MICNPETSFFLIILDKMFKIKTVVIILKIIYRSLTDKFLGQRRNFCCRAELFTSLLEKQNDWIKIKIDI